MGCGQNLLSMEPWAAAKKSFKLVWRCHQLLSGFLAKGHLPRVSRRSTLGDRSVSYAYIMSLHASESSDFRIYVHMEFSSCFGVKNPSRNIVKNIFEATSIIFVWLSGDYQLKENREGKNARICYFMMCYLLREGVTRLSYVPLPPVLSFFPFFFLPDVLCYPTYLIWRKGTPIEAMNGRTTFIDVLLAVVVRGFYQP